MTTLFQWNLYALPPAFAGLLILSLGIFVLIREKGAQISRAFSALTAFVAIWLLFFAGAYASRSAETALRCLLIGNVSITLIPSAFYLFTLVATDQFKIYRKMFYTTCVVSAGFLFGLLGSTQFLQGTWKYYWGYYSHYGPLSYLFVGYLFAVLVGSLRFYLREYRRLKGIKKKRSLIYLLAFSVAHLACVDYFAAYGINIYPFGYVFIIAFVVLMVAGINKYRLIEITPSFAAGQILKTMADPLLVMDRDGIIRVANEAASLFFNDRHGELSGQPASVTGLSFLRKENLARSLWAAKTLTFEDRFTSRERGELAVEISYSPIRDKSGHPIASICILKDITARKRAETELAEREKHYRLLAENISDVIWTMNGSLKLSYISPSIEKLTGHSHGEAEKLLLEHILMPSSFKLAVRVFSEERAITHSERSHRTLEVECKTKSGEIVQVEAKITILRDSEGKITEVLGVARDITERKKAMVALQESRHSYADLLRVASEPILTVNKLGVIQFLNPAAERYLGYQTAELSGKPFEFLMLSDCAAKTLQEFTLVLLGWRRLPFDIHIKKRDGSLLWMEVTPNLIRRYEEEPLIQVLLKESGGQNLSAQRQSA